MRRLLLLAALSTTALPLRAGPAQAPSSSAVAAEDQRLYARCAKRPVDADAWLDDASARKDLSALSAGEAQDLLHYSACRTLSGASGGCDRLQGLGGPLEGAAAFCRSFEASARMVLLMSRGGGDADAACRSMFGSEGKDSASVDRGCVALLSAVRAGDPLASCPALEKEKLFAPGESCRDVLAFWSGKPAACDSLKDPGNKRECKELASLAAGLRTPKLCAASPVCQALTAKAPASCAALARAFSAGLCARADKAAGARLQADGAQRKAEAQKARLQAEQLRRETSQKEVEAKDRLEAAKQAEAKAKVSAKAQAEAARLRFSTGQSMQAMPDDVKENIKRLEKGLPPLPAPIRGGSDAQPQKQ